MKLQFGVLAPCLLAGCAQVTLFGHTINEGRTPVPIDEVVPVVQKVGELEFAFTPQAQQAVAADARFDADVLRDTVAGELRQRELVNMRAHVGTQILIDTFNVRRTSNAVLFGYIPNHGTLIATVTVRDAAGTELRKFTVHEELSFGIAADAGKDQYPLADLFHGFAQQMADRLAGIPERVDDNRKPN